MQQPFTYKRDLIQQLETLDECVSLDDLQQATARYFTHKLWLSKTGQKMFGWGMITAVLTIIVAALRYRGSDVVGIVVYSCWAILPPAWFLYEYTWLFPENTKFDSHQLNDLKYKHALAGKLWAGVIVLITVILLFKHNGVKIVFG